MSRPRKKQHQAVLQFVHYGRICVDGLNSHVTTRKKLEKIKPTEGGRVLVLLAHVASEHITCNVKCALSERLFRKRLMQITGQRLQNINANTG